MKILGTNSGGDLLRVCCYCPQGRGRSVLEHALSAIGWSITDDACPKCARRELRRCRSLSRNKVSA